MRTDSLHRRLLLGFMVVAVLPLMILGWATLKYLSDSEKNEILVRNQMLAESYAYQVEYFLQQPLASMGQIEAVIRHHLRNEPKQIEVFFESLARSNPVFETLMLLSSQGEILQMYPHDRDLIGTDMSLQPFFIAASQTDDFYWSPVFRSPRTGEVTVTLSRKFEQVVAVCHLNLATLGKFTSLLAQHSDTIAFLVDDNGTIIAHPDTHLAEVKTNIQNLGIDPGLLTNRAEYLERQNNREPMFLGSRILPQTHWRLGVMQLAATALEQVHNFRWFIAIATFLAGCLALILAVIISRSTVRPLRLFSAEAQRVADGDYSTDLAPSNLCEIEDLRQAFAKMIRSIDKRETLLRQQADEFRSYYELGLIGMAEIDPNGRWLSLNPYLARMLGASSGAELIGSSWWDLSNAGETIHEKKLFAEVVAGGSKGYSLEKRFWLGDQVLDVEVSVAAGQYAPEGGMTMLIAIINDITEKKEIERHLLEHHQNLEQVVEERTTSLHAANIELTRSREEYAELYENAPDMYCTISVSPFRIVKCNQRIVNLLGRRKEELLMQGIEVLYPREGLDKATAFFTSIGALSPLQETEQQLCRADGSRIDAVLTVFPCLDRSGQLSEIRCCWVDIGAQKKVERRLGELTKELVRSNKELQQFAYVASHDLQEPLRMVASYTQLLADRYSDQLDGRAQKFIGYAKEGAERMQKLIEDLLSYSRITTLGAQLKPVSSETAIKTALANLHKRVQDTQAIITHDQLPTVRGDSTQLAQLFQNLLGNALKFRRTEPPRIHIGVRRQGRLYEFSVADNGIGIDSRYAPKIFVIFQRLHTREEFSGTGIGLALCKRIVERHGGTIRFTSELGRGTTFFFTLEAADELGQIYVPEEGPAGEGNVSG